MIAALEMSGAVHLSLPQERLNITNKIEEKEEEFQEY